MLYRNKKTHTNGSRHLIKISKFLLSKKTTIYKSSVFGKQNTSGRCRLTGHKTIGHRGSGKKKLLRNVFFNQNNNISIVISICYDPCRTAFVALCYNFLNSRFYKTLAINNVLPGSIVFSFKSYPELRLGSIFSLNDVPAGSLICGISVKGNFKYIKSAGTFGILVQKNPDACKIKMPSGTVKDFLLSNHCFLGGISNDYHFGSVLGKAGRSRLKNRRPHVRGVAMNPVDHPHGGQTSGGRPSVTPWGIPTKGKPTVNKKMIKKYV
jgi:large subunit ribosomal protein L2